METLFHDFRYALRLLRKSPGFAIAAVLTLALGMSANTVMFSVLNTVLLRPLPYPNAAQIVRIWETDARRGDMHGPVSPLNFVDWRSQSQSFEQMATYEYSSVVLTGQKDPARLAVLFVSAGFFDVLKVSPLKGRTFLPDEDLPGKARAAVLSYGAWRRYFASDPDIAGKSVLLDDQAYSIVGVMPPSFSYPEDGIEIWCLPGFDLKQQTGRGSHYMQAFGRLKPEVDLKQAQTEMDTIADRMSATHHHAGGVRLVSLQDEIVGNSRRSLLVLWLAVIAVLLIACANVAGLLMARAVARQKEVAIRSALGGSRARLVRQFLTESVLLSTLGGILGVALSYSAGRLVVAASHGGVPRLNDLQIDSWVLAFTAIACLITGIEFGLAPACSALRVDLNSALKGSGAAAQITDRLHLRSLIVVAEIALAMVLLVAGGLLAKTLWRLQHVDTGFKAKNILAFRFTVPRTKMPDDARRGALYESIAERLSSLPGVDSVGATNDLPFGGSRSGSSFDIEGRAPDPQIVMHAGYRTVSPGYFHTMRIRLLQGREFSLHDNRDGVFVAVINHAFVNKFFPDEDPLGTPAEEQESSL